MGLALQVIVIVIAVTLIGKRSAGSNIAPSPLIFTAIPPIEGLPVIPVHANAPSPASLPNGSNISPSPLVLTPPIDVNTPPPGFVQNVSGSNISPSPSTFTAIPVIPIDVYAPPPAILPNVSHIPPVLPPVNSAPGPETGHELVPPPTANTPSNQDPMNNSPKPAPVLPVTIPAPSSSIIDSPPIQDPINGSPKPAPVPPVTIPTPSSSINISPPAPIAPVTIPPPSSSPKKPPSVDPVLPHLDPPSSAPNITPKNKAPPLQAHAPEPVISIVTSPPPSPTRKIDGVPVASPPNRKSRPISPVKSPPLQAPPIQKQNASGNHSNFAPLSSPKSPPVIQPQAPASLPSTPSNNHQIGEKNITTPPPSSRQLPSPPPPIARAVASPKSHASKQRGRAAPPSPTPIPKDDVLPPPPEKTSLPLLSPKASPPSPSRSHSKRTLSPPIHALPPPPANEVSFLSPIPSPSGPSRSHTKRPLLPPIHALPPPPPNQDCSALTCAEPYTNTPPGSPCDCVYPMQVGLRLGVALYTFFPLVSELAEEISMGVFMRQSQVRIMGANAASQDPEKTIVLIDLVPLGEKFDKTTAFLTADRFWNKQVVIQSSLFGSYEVLYVRYPGLPPSPPSSVNVMDGEPYSSHGDNGRSVKPLGVDVSKVHHKENVLSASVVAIIVLSATLVLILSVAVFWVVISKRRQSKQGSTPPLVTLPFLSKPSGNAGSMLGSVPISETLSIRSSMAPYTGSAKTFSSSDIEKATNNFNATKVIGEGGFGRVYSGVLADGTEVAVKVLKRDDQQGGREFLAEVEMLSRLHHRNLVKLIGICTEDRARCLVYELIRNGSVESHLHGIDKEIAPLDWSSRLKIALGAARALAYLHEDSSPRVIHRDFKSSNILLEDDFTPKVSDFGLARTALEEENKHISTRVMGTFGYVAPEYAMTGHLLVKSDVYSYGVVLLELLTGKKPVDMSQPPGRENLVSWARPLLTNQEDLETIIDTSLGPDFPFDSIAKVSAIASMCVQPEVSHRPFMGEVVQALKLVCNECDVARDLESRSFSIDPSDTRSPVSNYDCGLDVESQYSGSGSDIYGFKKLEKDDSGSFRRHSSSGPLSIGRGDRVWHKLRGTVSEHGTNFRFWSGSH